MADARGAQGSVARRAPAEPYLCREPTARRLAGMADTDSIPEDEYAEDGEQPEETTEIPFDEPEADVLEQRQEVPIDEDEHEDQQP